jgi:hypothetical protein
MNQPQQTDSQGCDEYSVFPRRCPKTDLPPWGPCSGCEFLKYTPQRKYLYCDHPAYDKKAARADQQHRIAEAQKQREPIWIQRSLFNQTAWPLQEE